MGSQRVGHDWATSLHFATVHSFHYHKSIWQGTLWFLKSSGPRTLCLFQNWNQDQQCAEIRASHRPVISETFSIWKNQVLKLHYKICIGGHFWNGGVRTTKISNMKARRMLAKKKKNLLFRNLKMKGLQAIQGVFKKNSWVSVRIVKICVILTGPNLMSFPSGSRQPWKPTVTVKINSLVSSGGPE